MKCPACSESLPAGAERCPGCGAIVGPAVEGALAPNPRTVTPPPRDRVEPLRDIPGLPKKERTWRDEVQERVRRRRKRRAESSLPLFEQPGMVEEQGNTAAEETAPPPQPPAEEAPTERVPQPDEGPVGVPAPADRDFEAAPLSEEELAGVKRRAKANYVRSLQGNLGLAYANLGRVDEAVPLSDYLLENLESRVDMSSVDGRARMAELARPLLSRIPPGIYHDLLVTRLAQTIGMNEERLGTILAGDLPSQPGFRPAARGAPIRATCRCRSRCPSSRSAPRTTT